MKGILSVSVPGLLDGWAACHEKYGALKWGDVLEPAIDLADNGFPLSHVVAGAISADPMLQQFPTSRAVFTRNGCPLTAGEMLYQKDLARTFRDIAEEGRDAFYKGKTARSIVRFSNEQGGILTQKDLADNHCRWQEPISATYRGYTVYEAPPNSSGHVLLQELAMMDNLDLKSLGCNTTESIHCMVEAKKLAFADREAYVADPEFVDVPIAGLLSRDYARERARLIDPDRAAENVREGDPGRHQDGEGKRRKAGVFSEREDTTCFCVVGPLGQRRLPTPEHPERSGAPASSRGTRAVLLNNRMTYWHLEEDHVNCLAARQAGPSHHEPGDGL